MGYEITNGVIASRMSGVWAGWRTSILTGGAICVVFLGAAGIISERGEDRQIGTLENDRTELEQRGIEFRRDLVEMNGDLREFMGKQADVLGIWREKTIPRAWMENIRQAIGNRWPMVEFEADTKIFEGIIGRGREIERRNGELKEKQGKLKAKQAELDRRGGELKDEQAELSRRGEELKMELKVHDLRSTIVGLWSTLGGLSATLIAMFIFLFAIYQDLRRKWWSVIVELTPQGRLLAVLAILPIILIIAQILLAIFALIIQIGLV